MANCTTNSIFVFSASNRKQLWLAALFLTLSPAIRDEAGGAEVSNWQPAGSIVIYENPRFYAAFPSIITRPDGELLVAFRRAPERRAFGEAGITHTDPNSYLVLVRSMDGGKSWSQEPQLISAHPFGGSQDPCMVALQNGEILCASYTWSLMQPAAIAKLKQPVAREGNFVFLGGYLIRSKDGGKSWSPPFIPSSVPEEANLDIFGAKIPAYNRGAMCEGSDGRLYWVVASTRTNATRHTGTDLLISRDHGDSWTYAGPVARDAKIQFNETSLYETPNGTLVAFIRSEGFNDHTVIARSTDHGKNFSWTDAGFQGHPHHAIRLPDDRVLLVYGYRHAPFGIRARILNAECTDASTAPEIILREDGGNGDLGYPWATMVKKDRALVVYYFNQGDGTRQIAGTFLTVR